ncbi:PAS domain-containing protein [Pseudomonas aeruginosa]|nr:PAS domain-containing protein [Pseudomonas aeruginosa]ELO0610903.1 PAS domain-containing protein [Pseudomonas aeruginosa]
MNDQVLRTQTDRRQLQQIIAGLTEGVILIEPDQRILWANEAALAMHGVDSLQGLGADTGEYRERFRLRYRNNHPLQEGQYPAERLVAGECFSATWWWKCFPPPTRTPAGCTACAGWC